MPSIFERSADTDALIAVLRGVNDEITYHEAAKRAKLNTSRLKQVLGSARRILMVENILFGTQKGIGLVRLNDHDKVKLPSHRMKKINGQAKRGQKELATITAPDKLSNAEQLMVTTNRTIFTLVRQQTRRPQRDLP